VRDANTVSYQRSGIDEWYANGPLGLEQGFTVDRRPGRTGELVLAVGHVPATANTSIASAGTALTIAATSGGRSLSYSQLNVTDASGRHLPAKIIVSHDRILLRINDGGARYPLRIDPTVENNGAVLTGADSGADRDSFGYSVAISDDGATIVVGVPNYPAAESGEGAAFVFTEPASGGWQTTTAPTAILTPSGATTNGFGTSVGITGDGDTIVVGSPYQASSVGAAYVFAEPTTGGWQTTTQAAELTASDGAAQQLNPDTAPGDQFGTSVAISQDGQTVVVGAPNHATDGNYEQGAAYVFTEPETNGWQNNTQVAELTASGGAADDLFGTSVAISGDGSTIVAGAPGHASNVGAAYVFNQPATGGWGNTAEAAELTPELSTEQVEQEHFVVGSFGQGVAISEDGSTVAVGSLPTPDYPWYTVFRGSAFVFPKPTAGGWQDATQAAVLTPATDVSGAVAVSDDGTAVIVGSNYYSGAAYVFAEPSSGGWQDSETPATTVNGGGTNPIGLSVSVSADGTIASGASYEYEGTAAVYPPLPTNSVPPLISGDPVQGQTLDETHGTWSSNPTGYAYQWEDCDSSGANCSPISGATDQSYTLTSSDVGSTIEVQESASNISSGTRTPAGSAPTQAVQPLSATSPPRISGQALQGQTLTETHGSWNTTVTGYAYQWERCDASGANCTAIFAATGQSYTLTNADAGHTIVAQEAASNVGGEGIPANSVASAVVAPLAPTSTAVPTISGTAIESDTLTASLVAWTNRPTGVSYEWKDCDATGQSCEPIPGATGQSYSLAATDIGDRIVVAETATNAGGTSSPAASAATGAVPESGPVGLEIDNGDYATDDPNITIEPVWPAGTQSILISNNGGFRSGTASLSPTASVPWKLEQTGTDRLPKTVYVRFLGVGQDDINFTDDIILDETAPTIQSATLGGGASGQASAAKTPKLTSYKLRLKATDLVVGLCAIATNSRRASSGEAVTSLTSCKKRGILKLSKVFTLRSRTRPGFVRVQNSAGDWSRWMTAK
jgi:hypothetical protein